ncbi:MAG: gephyrin-like molybdotransferase Glp [Pseudomonadota bacterium]
MISVEEARKRLLALVAPLPSETVPLLSANGRVLAQPVLAKIDQPPFDASAMDGYAIRRADYVQGKTLICIGAAAAGDPFDGIVNSGEAVRVFTGGTLPTGADFVLIQENVTADGDHITISEDDQVPDYIRKAGQDFSTGTAIPKGTVLTPALVSLIASMGVAEIACHRLPEIAIISTGDELIPPGDALNPGQIYASNGYGLSALLSQMGAKTRLLPIASDSKEALTQVFEMAISADLIVTSGGASVGDHDLVMPVAQSMGLAADFHKVRMRPGKPLMAGRFKDGPAFVGLPGNPVSALVCSQIFLHPMIQKCIGQVMTAPELVTARLGKPLAANGPREHYMRGKMQFKDGILTAEAFDRQDSALITVLSEANCLIRRAPDAEAAEIGQPIEIIFIENI